MSERDEGQLIARALAGQAHAFDALVRDYTPQLYRLAVRMLGDEGEAEDALQETLIRAFRYLNRYRGDAAFGTWLYAIAARVCLTKRRAAKHRLAMVPYDEVQAAVGDTTDRILQREAGERVQQVLNTLPPQDRLLMILRFVEGLSHEEIARVLGCSAVTSRTRLLRARRLFQERYQRGLDDDNLCTI